jgi:NhaA family Na+:H+ antiporter
MRLSKLFSDFFESEKAGGIILIVCTIISISLANSFFHESYEHLWKTYVMGASLEHWINDGLMTFFFLLVGLELERELYIGELSDIKNAMFPIFAALGGMAVPAFIHFIFNKNTVFSSGAGIPMATDIAFALGILSLLGNKIPVSLKVFLTALAVIDDLGSILIIAIFYTSVIAWGSLIIALLIFAILVILNRLKVFNLIPYIIGGTAMWFFMLHSGVHATITGILLAFAIPFKHNSDDSPSNIMLHFLHKPVAYFILPVFALANTAILINGNSFISALNSNSLGISAGLIFGKPLGILLFSYIAVKTKVSSLPSDLSWKHLTGAGILGGIGFTMSIFITLLAFDNQNFTNSSKLAILIASLISGIFGYLWLKIVTRQNMS